MKFRISPLWWPLLGATSPFLGTWLVVKNKRYKKLKLESEKLNRNRIEEAQVLDLPEMDFLDLDVLVEWKVKEGFMRDAGVSYLFKTEEGSLLFDVGHGPSNAALSKNSKKMKSSIKNIDALAISHLHKDHIGGLKAARDKNVMIPKELKPMEAKPCFLPDKAKAEGFTTKLVTSPRLLNCGIASTGPLSRSLFLFGLKEEQALIVRLKNKGLVVFTGCGHPTIEVILEMVKKICSDPIYAIGGGLHFPVGEGRGNKFGIQFQTFIGTGKPPWKKVTIEDMEKTIDAINRVKPKKFYLSGHDTSDFALDYFKKRINADTCVLKAGESYKI